MAERTISGFKLTTAMVICPECGAPFYKELLTETPPLTAEDIVEADMHRVFPDPVLRAALIGLCPECKFCAWTTSFAPGGGGMVAKREPSIPYTKKYALAVKCARSRNLHPLDIAFMAMNGLWCAREAGEDDQLWLELVAFEHSRGMQDEYPSRADEDGMAHLMMGEIWRQLRQFDRAKREYEQALSDPAILPEVVRHQIGLCDRKVASITALPLHVVRQLFPMPEQTLDDLEEIIPTLEAASDTLVSAASPTSASLQPPESVSAPASTSAPVAPVAQSAPGSGSISTPDRIATNSNSSTLETASIESGPKVTAETAMLQAISTLLSAQASLLAAEEETAEVTTAKVEPQPQPTIIRPARSRRQDSAAAPASPTDSQPAIRIQKTVQPPATVSGATADAVSPVVSSDSATGSDSTGRDSVRRRVVEEGISRPQAPQPNLVGNPPDSRGAIRPMPAATAGTTPAAKAGAQDPKNSCFGQPAPAASSNVQAQSAPQVPQQSTARANAVSPEVNRPVAPTVPVQQQAVVQEYARPVMHPSQWAIPASQPAYEEPVINPEGISRVQNGNAVPRSRHSHEFRRFAHSSQKSARDGWMSDYETTAPVPGGPDATQAYRTAENNGDPLPDFDIDDPIGLTTKNKRVQQQQAPAQAPAPQKETTPAAPAASSAGQGSDHSDAIARVESYLSFSRALHTRSFLKYN